VEVVAGIATGLHVHPSGINAFGGGGRVSIGNLHFQIDLAVGCGGGVVDHGLDANLVALLDVIAVAGDFHPVGELTASAENMFFLVGAEEIGAVGVPEGGVMEDGAGDGVTIGVDKTRGVGQKKGIEGNGPKDIWGLRHHHVVGIGWKSDRALAESVP